MSDKRRKVKSRLEQAGEDGANPWPDEPSEFDPHSLGPDSALSTDDDEYEVDDETYRSFYGAVVLANVGLFGVTVGPMLWYFRGATLVGSGLFIVGAVALARTYRIQQQYRQRPTESGEPEDSADDDASNA